MEKKLRRLLVLLATVVLLVCVLATGVFATEADEPVCYKHGDLNGDGKVTHKDAIYLLYSATLGEAQYPVNQDCDFNKDSEVTSKDAFYLLYASFGDADCPLEKELIHNYYEPVWSWDYGVEGNVIATLKCGCPDREAIVYSSTNGIDVEEKIEPATCVQEGYKERIAKFTLNGKTYEATKIEPIAAKGHDMEEGDCVTDSVCKTCGEKKAAQGHTYAVTEETEATCTVAGSVTKTCSVCGDEKTVEGSVLPHKYEYTETVTGCTHEISYVCAACGATGESRSYVQHSYKVTLTKEATCKTDGVNTHTCTECGDSYSESVPQNPNYHVWDDGETTNGITTYTCTVCSATKTAVVAESTTGTYNAATSELQLSNGAVVALDAAVVEQAGEGEIEISVEEVTEKVNLTDAQKAQIGDNPVYDFNMVSVAEDGTETIVSDFSSAVTVSLPYILGEDEKADCIEDADCIKVWYIDKYGNLSVIENATYNNGYVTFTTNHFSYYTVTRLTAAERCERYGHNRIDERKDATCTAVGYIKNTCQRCGDPGVSEDIPALGHKYDETLTEATCTADGKLVKTCSVEGCGHTTTEVIPALGHNMVVTNETTASCTVAGEVTKECANCGFTTTEVSSKLAHDYGMPEVVEATCTEGGYVKAVCAACGYESISGETAPLGHAYQQSENAWTWSEDNSEATVALVCANDEAHIKVLNAVVTVKTANATCTEAGSATYTATAAYGGKTYSDSKNVEGAAAAGHSPAGEWTSNAAEHYHVCSVCNEKLGAAAHTWGAENVTKAPTCTTVGTADVSCTECGYTTEKTLPATGEHTYVNGICSVCGHDVNVCEHLRVYKTEIDLSGYNICEGSQIWNVACDCGEKSYPSFNVKCNLVEDENGVESTLPDGTKVTIWTAECPDCDLKVEYSYYNSIDVVECAYRWYEYYKVSANGTVITEGTWISQPMEEHPYTDDAVETYDMAEYGLCAGTIEVFKCPCGFATGWSFNGGCDWVEEETTEANGVTTITYTCSECGAVRVEEDHSEDDAASCMRIWIGTDTYYVDGVAVLKLDSKYGWSNHDYILESYEMDGESCEDGILYTMKCKVCGDINKNYTQGHVEFLSETIDLSGKGYCADTLYQYDCLCDEAYGFYELGYPDEDTWCEWTWTEGENGQRTGVCDKCGLTQLRTTTESEKDENCVYTVNTVTVLVDSEGNELATAYWSYMEEDHELVQTTELLVEGGSCKDGVKVTNTCEDCGYFWSYTEYNHVGQIVETFDLSDMYMCCTEAVHYTCACGESEWINFWDEGNECYWNWIAGYENSYIEQCTNCGVTKEEKWEDLAQIDRCHVKRHYTITLTKDGVDPVVIEYERIDTIHAGESFDLVMQDAELGCDGGVHVYMNCTVCEAQEDYGVQYGHSAWPVNTEVLCEEGLCGTLKLVEVSCACGYDSWSYNEWEGGECNFQYYDWDDEQQMNTSTCVECGAIRTRQTTETPIEGETCRYEAVVTTTFYDKNKNVLCTYSSSESGERHDNLCTFRMNGDTCEEGYYVIRTCQRCGNVEDYNDYYSSCETFRTEKEVLYTTDCGEIALYQYTSPCGERINWSWESDCSYDGWSWNEQTGMETTTCTECGIQLASCGEQTRIPGTCTGNMTGTFKVLVNDEVVAEAEKTYTIQNHEYVCSFQMQGETCNDGYTVSAKCAYCDASYSDDYVRYGHDTFLVAYYNLNDYGICSGEIHIYNCACGQNAGWGHNNWNCDYDYIGVYDAESGLPIKQCKETGVYFVEGETGEVDRETCTYTGTYYLKVFGTYYTAEPALNVSYGFSHDSHEYKATTLNLLNPEGTCEDGVYAAGECIYCQEPFTETYYWHQNWSTDILDLSQYDTCGGQIRTGGCACGANQFTDMAYACQNMECVDNWYEEDENGIGHHFWKHVCADEDCGLSFVEEHYTVDNDAACTTDSYWTYTFYVNDVEIGVFEQHDIWENHDYVASGVLAEGAADCSGGVTITETCTRCGYNYTYNTTDHDIFKTEAIDLTTYGSACGATLDVYKCACGTYGRYSINDTSACDFDYQSIDHWIQNVIDDDQYTSEGWQDSRSYSYLIKCAVSDPACGLTIRMSEYWRKEGCEVKEYQTWQLGYDETTGVHADVFTIATGEKHAYHNYVESSISEPQEDGTTAEGTLYTCADCGSTYQYLDYYDADNNFVKREETAVNALDNGENQKWYHYYTYGYVANDCNYMTESYDEYTRANGEVDWHRYEYTYDFSESCTRICNYSTSEGYTDTWTNEAHEGEREDGKPRTCSQFGYYKRYCDVCGHVWNEYYEDPTNHNWEYISENNYRCTECGLESTQGASGAIVMEDLSGTYLQQTAYIVGYWNRENIDFTVNVSLILEDSTTEDNQIDLDIPVWDLNETGVDAKWIDKGTTLTAAESAMIEAGYTGNYAIRITFVPVNYSDDLDYAITFDSLTYNPEIPEEA